MDYSLELRKFINSQYLYAGFRITAGVIIPAVILYHYGLLVPMINLPMGALFTSQTDNPGPPELRRNGMLVSILLNVIIILIAGYSNPNPLFIIIEIAFFGLFLSLLSIYGARANSIGLIALIVFILNVKDGTHDVLNQALLFAAGGIWYTLLSLLLYSLRPYRPVQQLLGETLMDTADYLRTRSLFYNKDVNQQTIYPALFDDQVQIHLKHEQLREMLFSTRKLTNESTVKGRMLLMIFLDSVDLMERIMTAQQEYESLHEEFDNTGILDQYYKNINHLADNLYSIGLAVQAGEYYKGGSDIEEETKKSSDKFDQLRSELLNAENIEGFIKLRHILYNLQDLAERIKRLKTYTSFDKNISRQLTDEVDFQQFTPKTNINLDLLFSNLSLESAAFRHALRTTLALLTGYFVSMIFTISHGYWVMLTIATIIKPAYSLTKERNVHRLIGTFIGAAAGFTVLSLNLGQTTLFVIIVVSMIIAYSMLKLNYGVFCAFLTLFLLLNFHFLDPNGIQKVLLDRIMDTVIGSAIAYIFSISVLPTWEHQQTTSLIRKAIQANRTYFDTVANAFTGRPADMNTFRLSRKDAFVALANLSDNFQRMMSEPKSKQSNLPQYHQFVATNHMLTSHVASLSYYAQRSAKNYANEDFEHLIKEIDHQFESVLDTNSSALMENNSEEILPLYKKLQELLEQRKKQLQTGVDATGEQVRKTLSELKAIIDQFSLISSTLNDQKRILEEINGR